MYEVKTDPTEIQKHWLNNPFWSPKVPKTIKIPNQPPQAPPPIKCYLTSLYRLQAVDSPFIPKQGNISTDCVTKEHSENWRFSSNVREFDAVGRFGAHSPHLYAKTDISCLTLVHSTSCASLSLNADYVPLRQTTPI